MNVIESVLQRLRHNVIMSAKKGYGSFITMQIGQTPTRNAPIREERLGVGSFHIWIQYCKWEFRHHGAIFLTDATITESNASELERLVGDHIERLHTDPLTGHLTLYFSRDSLIQLYPDGEAYAAEDDLIGIFEAEKAPLSFSVERQWYFAA